MIDLTEVSGLPIKFDEEKGKFIFTEDIYTDGEKNVPLAEIIPILLNKYLKYPEIVYKHNKKVFLKDSTFPDDITYDLIYIPYGLLGIEYNKTHVFYTEPSNTKYACLIEVLTGNLSVIIQKNQPKEDYYQYDTYIDEINIVNLTKGQKIAIPTGTFYTFVNTGLNPLVLSKVCLTNHKEIDYSILKREKGLACYIISKNAKIETVANPKYKMESKLKSVSFKQFIERKKDSDSDYYNLCKTDRPLYQLLEDMAEIFKA